MGRQGLWAAQGEPEKLCYVTELAFPMLLVVAPTVLWSYQEVGIHMLTAQIKTDGVAGASGATMKALLCGLCLV